MLVAQQQLAEYADQKDDDAATLANEAVELEALVLNSVKAIGDSQVCLHNHTSCSMAAALNRFNWERSVY